MIYSVYLLFTLIMAELLSNLNIFNATAIRNTTLLFIVVLIVVFIKNSRLQDLSITSVLKLKTNKILILLPIVTVSALVSGIFIAQNLWDAMKDNLPRYLHWFQNGNLDYYFTVIPMQYVAPPVPDLLFAQMFAIFSNDRFLFLPTLISILVASFFVYKIAFLLTENISVSVLAFILSLLVPSQVAFMSSTHTDPVSTALVVILLYYAILSTKSIDQKLVYKMLLLMPLFITIKTTGLIFSIPIYLFVIYRHRKFIFNHLAKNLMVFLFLIIPALPYAFRVLTVERGGGSPVFISTFSLEGILANFSRISLSSLQTPIGAVNDFLENGLYGLFDVLNLNLNPEGYGVYGDFYLSNSLHGDLIGNPLYVILLIVASLFLFKVKTYRMLALLIVFQLLLLSVIIAWHPWINRYTSTLWVIGSILIAIWLFSLSSRVRLFLLAGVFAYSSFWVFYNPARSLLDPQPLLVVAQNFGMKTEDLVKVRHDLALPREKQYFSVRPEIETSYLGAIDQFKKQPTERLYIYIGGDDFEYPIWALTDFEVEIYHLDKNSPQLEEVKTGEAYLFCTVDCSDLGLKPSFKGEFASLWIGS